MLGNRSIAQAVGAVVMLAMLSSVSWSPPTNAAGLDVDATEEPPDFSSPDQLSQGRADYLRGLRALKANQFRQAVLLFSDAIASGELTPRFRSDAHYFRGRALTRLARSELALLEFTRSVDYWPDNIKALRTRCRALTLKNRLDEAQKDCDRAIYLDVEDWRAWFTRGVLYDAKKLPNLARVDYVQAQRRGPENLTDIPYVANRFRRHGLITSFYSTPPFKPSEN